MKNNKKVTIKHTTVTKKIVQLKEMIFNRKYIIMNNSKTGLKKHTFFPTKSFLKNKSKIVLVMKNQEKKIIFITRVTKRISK